MIIIKWILLIALLKYSHGLTTKPPIATTTTPTTINCAYDETCISFHSCNTNHTVDCKLDVDERFGVEKPCPKLTNVCCKYSEINKTEKNCSSIHDVPTKCGILNPEGVGIKLLENTDHEANFGEFPWMVAVMKKIVHFGKTTYKSHCGGSLIHPSVVLTSGSKFVGLDPKTLNVRAGEWNIQEQQDYLPHVESDIASIKIHENSHKHFGTYYIALLFLETSIENAEHINTICLPPPNTIFDGASCFVTGWGKDKFAEEGTYRALLKKIELSVIERQKCQEMFRKTDRLGKRYVFPESLICAGGEGGKDACTGDGGSPLVCPVPGQKGHYFQAGIVAWGLGCGKADIPGAYTNVAFFAEWIENQIQNKGLNSSSYTI